MAETPSKVPVKSGTSTGPASGAFESLRHEIDRIFDDFGQSFWTTPFRRSIEPFWGRFPSFGNGSNGLAVDVTETDKAFEIKADLPGMTEKDIEVKLANDVLTIRGEKHEEKEEKRKDYYLRERQHGSFERSFHVPDGIDPEKVDANFKNGVLTVTLAKTPAAQKAAKKIEIKAA
ncbi:MAG TPA: Hsp20/alpha crystallin family protein [Xanthobacteraceae bacterium]|nr:Hsp20/alpha crystallin family protein [Xanthobacteraceae bacterium]